MNDEQRLVRDARGEPEEVVGSWSDVTERKLAEQEAEAARERIDRLLATSPAVIYSFKARDDFAPTFISRNVKDLLGYDREEYLASPDFWQSRIHPDDHERVLAEFERLAGRAPQQRVPLPQGRRLLVLDQRRAHLVRDVDEPAAVAVIRRWIRRVVDEPSSPGAEQQLDDGSSSVAAGLP